MNDKNIWMPQLPSQVRDKKRRLFRVLEILTVKWTTGDIPEECRILTSMQLMFLRKEKDPITQNV